MTVLNHPVCSDHAAQPESRHRTILTPWARVPGLQVDLGDRNSEEQISTCSRALLTIYYKQTSDTKCAINTLNLYGSEQANMTTNSSDSEPESCETGVQLHHIHDGDEMKNIARLSLSMQEKELPSTADGESQDEKVTEQSEVQVENRNEMRGLPLGLVIASLLSAVFCVALDNTSMFDFALFLLRRRPD